MINWAYYISLGAFDSHQAACLLNGIDPNNVKDDSYQPNPFIILPPASRLMIPMDREKANKLVSSIDNTRKKLNMEFKNTRIAIDALLEWSENNGYKTPEEFVKSSTHASAIENEHANDVNLRELKKGIYEIWLKERKPETKIFFPDRLKKYINKPGSPIREVYSSGKTAGISFELSNGTTGHRTKKTIQNWVHSFKKISEAENLSIANTCKKSP